jgi:hypothetical protein
LRSPAFGSSSSRLPTLPARGMLSAVPAINPMSRALIATECAAWILVTSFLWGCGSLRPITDSKIDGRPAQRVAVVLAAPFSFRHLLSTYTLPAGRYEPALEDDSGDYFAAPTKIIESQALSTSSLYDVVSTSVRPDRHGWTRT